MENTTRPAGPVDAMRLRLLAVEDLNRQGVSIRDVLQAVTQLDYATIQGLTRRFAGHPDQWADVLRNGTQGLRILMDGHVAVGYWQFVALNDRAFEKAVRGELFDDEVTAENTRPLSVPGSIRIYAVGVSVLAAYRGMAGRKLMYEGFGRVLAELADLGVFVEEICATAHTAEGAALARSLGLHFVCRHAEHGSVYARRMADAMPRILTIVPGLRHRYQGHAACLSTANERARRAPAGGAALLETTSPTFA